MNASFDPYPLLTPDHDQPTPGIPLSTISARPLPWLWLHRIPFAHLTLLHGPSGLGLSLFSLHLAACVSAGHSLPDGSPCPQGTVILVSPFDSPAHTILPRLEAAGGDPAHVLLLNAVPVSLSPSQHAARHVPSEPERPFSLAHDLPTLETVIQRTSARLVILDTPDLARDAFTRPLLPRLASLAARTNCAILLIRPLSKSLSNPFNAGLYHTLPLISFVHSALLLAFGPGDTDRLLITTKHTLSTSSPSLCFDLVLSPSGIPTLHPVGDYAIPDSTPLPSFQRQHLLDTLHDASTPLSPQSVTSLTGGSYEAARKMLQRLLHDGDLVSPARGLYTTPNHPSLNSTSPVPHVPNVPGTDP